MRSKIEDKGISALEHERSAFGGNHYLAPMYESKTFMLLLFNCVRETFLLKSV